jgi:hypothetical protein
MWPARISPHTPFSSAIETGLGPVETARSTDELRRVVHDEYKHTEKHDEACRDRGPFRALTCLTSDISGGVPIQQRADEYQEQFKAGGQLRVRPKSHSQQWEMSEVSGQDRHVTPVHQEVQEPMRCYVRCFQWITREVRYTSRGRTLVSGRKRRRDPQFQDQLRGRIDRAQKFLQC